MSALLTTPSRGSQLDGLRQSLAGRVLSERPRPTTDGGPVIVVCASGRGGSGTSLASVLLALSAAGDGHRTLLVDGDELVGPHALLLGARPPARWPALLGGRVAVAQLPVAITDRLALIAGGRTDQASNASPLTTAERRACMARVHTLAESYALVVIDAGSRLEAVLAALEGGRGTARLVVVTAGRDPIAMASAYALLKAVHARLPHLDMDILTNRLDDSTATRVADALALGAQQFLARPLAFAGALPHDLALDAALQAGMPFLDAVTGSPVAVAAHDTVLRMLPVTTTSRSGI
jgi:flagellar biosynthesis protein FlhG